MPSSVHDEIFSAIQVKSCSADLSLNRCFGPHLSTGKYSRQFSVGPFFLFSLALLGVFFREGIEAGGRVLRSGVLYVDFCLLTDFLPHDDEKEGVLSQVSVLSSRRFRLWLW